MNRLSANVAAEARVVGAVARSRLRQPSAFTLVEAALAITLTLILTAAAIGGLVGVQAWRGSSAVRRFQADLLYARDAALLSTRRVMCVLSAGTSYQLQQESTPGTGNVVSAILQHPMTDQPWQVAFGSIASGLSLTVQPALNPTEFGFGTDGRLISRNGGAQPSDVVLTFNKGAVVTLRTGSGLCELRWP